MLFKILMCRAKSLNCYSLMSCNARSLADSCCFLYQNLKSEFSILVFCSISLLGHLIFKLLQIPMLVKIFLYKYVNKTSNPTSVLLPRFILFNPILVNQDFVKADCNVLKFSLVHHHLGYFYKEAREKNKQVPEYNINGYQAPLFPVLLLRKIEII